MHSRSNVASLPPTYRGALGDAEPMHSTKPSQRAARLAHPNDRPHLARDEELDLEALARASPHKPRQLPGGDLLRTADWVGLPSACGHSWVVHLVGVTICDDLKGLFSSPSQRHRHRPEACDV